MPGILCQGLPSTCPWLPGILCKGLLRIIFGPVYFHVYTHVHTHEHTVDLFLGGLACCAGPTSRAERERVEFHSHIAFKHFDSSWLLCCNAMLSHQSQRFWYNRAHYWEVDAVPGVMFANMGLNMACLPLICFIQCPSVMV